MTKKPLFFYGYVCVAAASVVMLLSFGTLYSFGVFFKPLLAEFGWNRAETSGAFSLAFFMQGFMGLLMGRLNDRYGPNLVILFGALLLSGGFMLMALVREMWHLYLLYGVVIAAGVSGAGAMMAIPSRWFKKRRGLMTGIVISGVGLGTVIMPPLATWLIKITSWRNAYIIIGVIVLVLMVIISFFLKKEPKQLGLVAYGDAAVRTAGPAALPRDYTLKEASRTWQFWMLGFLFFFHTYCVQFIMAHVALYAQGAGLTLEAAAAVISLVGGASIFGRLLMGTLVDRFGSRPVLTANFLIKAAALAWLLFARTDWMFIIFALTFGFGYGGAAVAQMPIVADLFGLTAISVILAGISLVGTCGGASGPVVAGRIFDITGSYFWAIISGIVLSVFGFILAMFLKPIEKKKSEE